MVDFHGKRLHLSTHFFAKSEDPSSQFFQQLKKLCGCFEKNIDFLNAPEIYTKLGLSDLNIINNNSTNIIHFKKEK